MASGPNAGTQLKSGAHKGRLVIPMNEGPFGKWVISCIYSDDGGKSWKLSQPTANMKGMVNETSIAETDNGGVVMVARHWGRRQMPPHRVVPGWRGDLGAGGGRSGAVLRQYPEFPDDVFPEQPACLRRQKPHPVFRPQRGVGALRDQVAMSYDNGKTWPVKKLLGEGGFAYSSLAMVEPGVVGVLYEENQEHIKKLKFVPITIEWLTDGKDAGLAPGKKAPVLK